MEPCFSDLPFHLQALQRAIYIASTLKSQSLITMNLFVKNPFLYEDVTVAVKRNLILHYFHFHSKICRCCSLRYHRKLHTSAFDNRVLQMTSPLAKPCSATIQNKKKKAVIPPFLEAFYHLHSPAKGWRVPQGLMIMKNVVLKKRNLS